MALSDLVIKHKKPKEKPYKLTDEKGLFLLIQRLIGPINIVDRFFTTAEWNIPAKKMKMRQPHLVPLSRQAILILQELFPVTGGEQYVFPSIRTQIRPMSDNTMNSALRKLGYTTEEVTAHGFRATARTLLDEVLDFRPDIIEHQLAHAVKDPNGRAYNRTSHFQIRREMMQTWANYLDELAKSR